MAANMNIITAIYCTTLEVDHSDKPESDHQAVPGSSEFSKHSRELLHVRKESILVFPLD